MVATPVSLFAALTAKNTTNASGRDDASTTGITGVDFAALIQNSAPKSRDNSSWASDKRDQWQRSSSNDSSSASDNSSRMVTPREAQRALDRLSANNTSSNASGNSTTAHSNSTSSDNSRTDTSSSASSTVTASTSTTATTTSASTTTTSTAANDNAQDTDALASLKAQLQAIVDSDTPASLQDITAELPAADATAALSLFPSTTPLIDAQASVDTQAPLLSIRHILSRLNQALNLTSEVNATVTAAANAQTDAAAATAPVVTASALLNVDANIETAVGETTGEKKPTEEQLPQNDDSITLITPLAQSLLAIPAIQTKTEASASIVATAAPTESVAAIDVAKAVSIDTLIPSIALSDDDKKKALPDVELPKANVHAAADAKVEATPAPQVAAIPSKLEQQLQALTVVQQTAVVSGDANVDVNGKPAVGVSAVGAVGAASPLTGVGMTAGVSGTAASNVVTLASNVINNAPVREQVHVAITKAASEGVDQITIQLDPLGLGRVEVKMHTGHDGQTSLSFLVDKPETFDALSRDARGLERMLQDSGLKADSGGMQFNLRQQTHADTGSDRGNSNSQSHASADISATSNVTATASASTRNYRIGVQDGIDIHA